MELLTDLQNREIKDNRELLKFIFISTFIIGFLAHGYRYFNLLFSHDSLFVYQDNFDTYIMAGRFLAPLYFKLRGIVYPPTLIGILSLIFLALSVYFLCQIFHFKKRICILGLMGLLIVNPTISLLNATYILDADRYMLAFLFSVLAVYLFQTTKYGYLFGAAFVFLSLGLYQSYIQVSTFLILTLLVLDVLEDRPFKETLFKGIKGCGMVLLGLILYYFGSRIAIKISPYEYYETYNSVMNVGAFGSLSNIIENIKGTYQYVWTYFTNPTTHLKNMVSFINGLFFALFLISSLILFLKKNHHPINLLFYILMILVLPFALNLVYFISQGLEHYLMIYSFYFVYLFVILISEKALPYFKEIKFRELSSFGIGLLIILLFFSDFVYANQLYLKKEIEYENTMFSMVRVVDRMEQTPGYTPGKTPVVIIGALNDSALAKGRRVFDYTSVGCSKEFAVTLPRSYRNFFNSYLSYPINLLGDSDTALWKEKPEVKAMPGFPDIDSIQLINNTLVVKLSD